MVKIILIRVCGRGSLVICLLQDSGNRLKQMGIYLHGREDIKLL